MNMPEWWLVVSGIFFILSIIVLGVVAALLIKLIGLVKSIQPQITTIMTRMDDISKKVDDMSGTMRDTVSKVGQQAQSFASTAGGLATGMSGALGKYSSLIGIAFTAIRLIREFQGVMGRRRKPQPKMKLSSNAAQVDKSLVKKP